MAVRERYQYVVDLVVDNANRALGTFGANVDGVERSTGRLQGTLGRAGDFLRTHMAEAATAAGTALVAFGVKSVQAFQDAAIEAGKFSDATGLSTDAASRWIEVGGDIGVTGENMRSLFTRLNKAIGDNAPVISELGIETKRFADGQVDVNGTMLEAIERLNQIRNPTERAAAAQRLFGRNYAETAELIFGSADELRSSLEGVSDAIAIDDDERVKAERLRAAFDELGDTLTEVQLIFGEYLAPKIVETVALFRDLRGAITSVNDAIPGLGDLASPIQSALNPLGALVGQYNQLKSELDDLIPSEAEFGDLTESTTAAVREAYEAHGQNNEVVDEAAMYAEVAAAKTQALADAEAEEREQAQRNIQTTRRLTDEYNTQRQRIDDLIGRKTALVGGDIAVRQAQRDAQQAVTDLNTVITEQGDDLAAVSVALDTATAAQLNAAQAAADQRAAQMEANGSLVDAKVRNQLLKEEMERLAGQVDGPLRAAIQRYIDDLGRIPANVNTTVTANGTPGSIPIRPGGRYATGTTSASAGIALVGENGPELVELNGGERIFNARETGQIMGNQSAGVPMSGGGGLYVAPGAIVINGNASGDEIVRALDAYVRRGGFVPNDVRRKFSA